MSDAFPLRVGKLTEYPLLINTFGLYGIEIIARCQLTQTLRVEIDGHKLREVPPTQSRPQYEKNPSTWNGLQLHGQNKKVIFILPLNKGNHLLRFYAKDEAEVINVTIRPIDNPKHAEFVFDERLENGEQRPYVTFALVNLPLKEISADVSVAWHYRDGDEAKLIIDGRTEQNPDASLDKNWVWSASPLQLLSGSDRETKNFIKNLKPDVHYIEFWVDDTPTIHSVILDFGEIELVPPLDVSRPTVDHPKWTGNFADDTDQMLVARVLMGEVRNTAIPDEGRIAVAWAIRNRVAAHRKMWGDTYFAVITHKSQFSSLNKKSKKNAQNWKYITNPLWSKSSIDKRAWQKCYDIAVAVLHGEILDPTNGANSYYDDSITPPSWATPETLTLTVTYKDRLGIHKIFFHRV